jgi:hypothetical protein
MELKCLKNVVVVQKATLMDFENDYILANPRAVLEHLRQSRQPQCVLILRGKHEQAEVRLRPTRRATGLALGT